MTAVTSILLSLEGSGAIAVATGFWIVSMIGFITATLAFRALLTPGEASGILAVVSAVVSTVGIVLFGGRGRCSSRSRPGRSRSPCWFRSLAPLALAGR
jgi:hypothetical protein